jgi:hypothetical protein
MSGIAAIFIESRMDLIFDKAHDVDLKSNRSFGGNGPEVLTAEATPALREFLTAAAAVGLVPGEAMRLGVERALLLTDLAELDVDRDIARRLLRTAARRARAEIELTDDLATWVRTLYIRRPLPPPRIAERVSVRLDDRLLVRAGADLRTHHLRAECVPEMVVWELAAVTSGRSMGEWGLRELGLARLLGLCP